MENNQLAKRQETFKQLINQTEIKTKFNEILGKNSTSFLMSVLNCVQNNERLKKAEPNSILMASAVAGTLNLPIDPNLGQSYIIPYNVKVKEEGKPDQWVTRAQFQIGYKGLIQLAHRSGQFLSMNTSEVRKGEFENVDRMTGEYNFNWIQDEDERQKIPIIGFVAFFKLKNGFEKCLFMTEKQMKIHGQKYSKTFSNEFGRWSMDFCGMGKKTVLKLLFDKYAPKSVDMQTAIVKDQGIFDGDGLMKYEDNKANDPVDLEQLYKNQRLEIKELLKNVELDQKVSNNIFRVLDNAEFMSYPKVIQYLKNHKKYN